MCLPSRRQFLQTCGGAVAALALGAGSARAVVGGERKEWMIPELSRELFEARLGETFELRSEEGPSVEVKLVKVMESGEKHTRDQAGRARTEGFSVFFEGPRDPLLPQGMYTVTNPAFGETFLFVVPVLSKNPGSSLYEVVINRIISA